MKLLAQEKLPNGYLVSRYERERYSDSDASPRHVVRVVNTKTDEVGEANYYDAFNARIAFHAERRHYLFTNN